MEDGVDGRVFHIKIEAVEDFDFAAKKNLHVKKKRHLSPISKSAI